MHEIETRVLIPLPSLLGIDLSVTNQVVLLWAAAGVTFLLLWPCGRRKGLVPHGPLHNLFEALVELIDRQVVAETLGRTGRSWAPFLLSLFFFILFANLMGLVPAPEHVTAVTSNLSVTAGLAAIVFGVALTANIRCHGLGGFLRSFVPAGLPVWVQVMVAPIEVVSWLAKPISLAVRLFANMLAGHQILLVFIALQAAALWLLKPLPLLGAMAMEAFEIFVSFIQAFIFTLLAAMYIRDAVERQH